MTIGERIRALRGERTQQAIATAVGVERQAVTQWESGVTLPSSGNLARLCDFFELSDAERLELYELRARVGTHA